MNSYSGCSKGVLKSVQVLLNGIGAVIVLTLIILKFRALSLVTQGLPCCTVDCKMEYGCFYRVFFFSFRSLVSL